MVTGAVPILSRLAADGATLATWTVAGDVRRALRAAQFDVTKRPGFWGKKTNAGGAVYWRKTLLGCEERLIFHG